jgi:hypothetical protein
MGIHVADDDVKVVVTFVVGIGWVDCSLFGIIG